MDWSGGWKMWRRIFIHHARLTKKVKDIPLMIGGKNGEEWKEGKNEVKGQKDLWMKGKDKRKRKKDKGRKRENKEKSQQKD